MKFILKTTYLSFLCLFFAANINAQTTKEMLQTLTPDETVKTIKISSSIDSDTIVDTWSGDFILIYIKIKAKKISSVKNCRAKYEEEGNTLTINLNPNLPEVFALGETAPATVKYEIFIPEELNIK